MVRADIVPANDTTGTTVTPSGNRFDIDGGSKSADGANLFHSFSQFDLSADRVANFLTTPEVRNILGRVVGGNASFINGLIKISGGGSPNLFLLNPSGVIFGPNARINVPADFTVTTATGIGFDGGWFDAFSDPNYATLVGDPNMFAFTAGESGAIVNAGELVARDGSAVVVLGSTVVNTGRVEAPGGNIVVAAVAGTQNVRLTLPGHRLSFEMPAAAIAGGIQAEDLPTLLAGNGLPPTGLTAEADGSVKLAATGETLPTAPGSTAVAGGSLDASGPAGGTVQVLGDRIGLYSAEVSASGLAGAGGEVLVGGEFQGGGTTPTATYTFVDASTQLAADSLRSGDGGLIVVWSEAATVFQGEARARGGALSGNGGTAEFSSAGNLTYVGSASVDAPNGTPGSILFDPAIIRIVAADSEDASSAVDSELTEDGIINASDGGDATFIITDQALLDTLSSGSGAVSLAATADIIIEPDANLVAPSSGSTATLNFVAPQISLSADVDPGVSSAVFEGDVVLVEDVTVTGEDFVIFNGSINGSQALTVSSTGLVGLQGPVGNTTPPTSLTIDSPQTSIGDLVSASNFVSVSGPVQIDGDVNAAGPLDLAAGSVDIAGTVSLQPTFPGEAEGGISSLSLTSTSGDVSVGAIAPFPTGGAPATRGPVAINAPLGSVGIGGSIVTDGGDVLVSAAESGISIGSIDSTSASGTGGDVTVATSGFLQLTSTNDFSDSDGGSFGNSIDSFGSSGDGAIVLTHGGNGEIPFVVGDAQINGTAGPLNSGGNIISEGSFLESVTVGNISILTEAQDDIADVIDEADPSAIVGISNTVQQAVEQASDAREDTSSTTASLGGQAIARVTKIADLTRARLTLAEIQESSGVRPALIYVNFVPAALEDPGAAAINAAVERREAEITQAYEQYYDLPQRESRLSLSVPPASSDRLEILLVTPEGEPQRFIVEAAERDEVIALAQQLYRRTSNPVGRNFLPFAQQLYSFMIAPLEASLEAAGIENLVFIMPEGLRLLPVAALHDGEKYLVQSYSAGLAPSLSLTDTRYRPLQGLKVFAAGASNFADENALGPLPAVGIEVESIATDIWEGDFILDEGFTVEAFKAQRRRSPTGIVHLATHADFERDSPDENYIQFFDRQLRIDEVRELGLNQPPVELMVLSACRTAFGDADIELGFGGLAVQAGVKTAVASLWYVGDTGTLALMTEFYSQFETATIKAEALRAAQVSLIEGKTRAEGGQIRGSRGAFNLPEALAGSEEDLSHPFYWAAFTTIGSPW